MEHFRNLYVHFPFCEAKCHYCDFFSLPEQKHSDTERARIYQAILRERQQFSIDEIDTIFLGGGTPSLVPTECLAELMQSLHLTSLSEVTMEANPSSITKEKALEWKKIGVNRVSMGMQALNDTRLEWLGRVHDKKSIFHALDSLFEAGIERISADYIIGVPGQTSEIIRSEIAELFQAFPKLEHVSAYLLTLHSSNKKFKELLGEEEQLAQLETTAQTLLERGLEQYEISNFAKPGKEARHNQNYWLGGSYLGLGPSAHSFHASTKKRVKNWASLGKYAEKIEAQQSAEEWNETITPEQERIEYLMLRLRRREGLSLQEYNARFDRDLASEKASLLAKFLEQDLARLEEDHLRLTPRGFFLSDPLISKLV